jgi:peptidoglycan/LPS O-acetylase OafA/YrhL
MKEVTKQLDYINSLRGLAVLGVIMVHTSMNINFGPGSILSRIIGNGAMGVQLFYIASAFTLFLSFQNRIEEEKFPIRNFFIRRFFRIGPMYYIGIVYYLFQNGFGWNYWLGDASYISVPNILSNFFFLHGFNPYWINSVVPGGWSIAIEMCFYLCLPFIFFKIRNINSAIVFFVCTLLLKTVMYYILVNHSPIGDIGLWSEYLFFYFPNQLPVFALGIIMYFYITGEKEHSELSGKIMLILGCILLALLAINKEDIFFSNHILFGISFLIIGIALSRYKPVLLVNPVINYIGKISFSMYITHFAVLHWLRYFNLLNYSNNPKWNYCIRFYLVVLLTAMISALFYKCIEIPFQELGKKWIRKLGEGR